MRVPQVGSDLVVAPDVADGWAQIEPGDRVVVGPTSLSRFVSQNTAVGWGTATITAQARLDPGITGSWQLYVTSFKPGDVIVVAGAELAAYRV